MATGQQAGKHIERRQEAKSPFDEHMSRQPASRQTLVKWILRLALVAFILPFVLLIYGIYASISWRTVGQENVVLAWLYFFMSGGVGALLLGLATILARSSIPLPFGAGAGSQRLTVGDSAVRSGWGIVGISLVMVVPTLLGVWAVRAGRFGIEDFVFVIVSFYAGLGLVSAGVALVRAVMRSLRA